MFTVIDEAVVIDFKPRMVSPSHTDTATVVAERVIEDTDARIFTAERPNAPCTIIYQVALDSYVLVTIND